MINFAQKILQEMSKMTKELEITLGPDTGDLGLRVGVHSGPVTAGVLRGERARFQLFGDTMNVAARIEASGDPGRIHVSNDTAKLLKKAGKDHWLEPRDAAIYAKGKGEMQTYWVKAYHDDSSDSGTETLQRHEVPKSLPRRPSINEKENRLIDWNVEMLKEILVQIMRKHRAQRMARKTSRSSSTSPGKAKDQEDFRPFDCVKEIITLPEFEADLEGIKETEIEVPPVVLQQLHQYVATIASMYRANSFHNFEVRTEIAIASNWKSSFSHPTYFYP